MHNCPDCGIEHEAPEPVVIEEAVDVEPVAEANVEIARIEADRDIKVAKIERGMMADEMEIRLAEVEGNLRGMREVLDALVNPPAPEPAPIVIEEPEPEVEMEIPPKEERHEPKAPSRRKGFF